MSVTVAPAARRSVATERRACALCGEWFDARVNQRPQPHIYCSAKCRMSAYGSMRAPKQQRAWRGQAPAAVQGNPEYRRYKGTFGEAEFAAILKAMDKAKEDGVTVAPMPEVAGSTRRDAADDSGICPVCGSWYQFPLRREGMVRVCSVGCLLFVE